MPESVIQHKTSWSVNCIEEAWSSTSISPSQMSHSTFICFDGSQHRQDRLECSAANIYIIQHIQHIKHYFPVGFLHLWESYLAMAPPLGSTLPHQQEWGHCRPFEGCLWSPESEDKNGQTGYVPLCLPRGLLYSTCPNIEPSCPPTLVLPPKSTVLVLSGLLKLPCTTVEPNCHLPLAESTLEKSFELGEGQDPDSVYKLQRRERKPALAKKTTEDTVLRQIIILGATECGCKQIKTRSSSALPSMWMVSLSDELPEAVPSMKRNETLMCSCISTYNVKDLFERKPERWFCEMIDVVANQFFDSLSESSKICQVDIYDPILCVYNIYILYIYKNYVCSKVCPKLLKSCGWSCPVAEPGP